MGLRVLLRNRSGLLSEQSLPTPGCWAGAFFLVSVYSIPHIIICVVVNCYPVMPGMIHMFMSPQASCMRGECIHHSLIHISW